MLFFLVFISSCADQGMGPTGGPKDSIPPVVLNCIPSNLQTQFSGKEIEVLFNEYVILDNLSEKLILSPPFGKKPTIRIKGKSVIIKLEEDLIPDRTYAVDFCDGIKDYNEGNIVTDLRLVFSTGLHLDTLRISGFIYDAKTLDPMPNVLAALYSMDNDSLFRNLHPDFVARTDSRGYFLFNNLPAGEFKLYGIKDDDKNLHFSNPLESIAFCDSMISPSAFYVYKTDTVIANNDTTISYGYTDFFPKDLNLFLFQDDLNSQYLVSFKREKNDRCLLAFNEPVADSVNINLIGFDSISNVIEMEYSPKRDSLLFWITDSTISKIDTLYFSVTYTASDSIGNDVITIDTLKMLFTKPTKTNKKENEKIINDELFFHFSSNLTSSGFDLNNKVIIEAPSPVLKPDSLIFKLFELLNDSSSSTIPYKLIEVNDSKRKFIIDFALKENTKYELKIDTAVVKTVSGLPNAGFNTKFSTQKKDYYGTVILSISNIEVDGIIQLIKNSKEESVVKEVPFNHLNKQLTLDYIKPDKYLIKLIVDANHNGKWDTGFLKEKRQPETVYYLQKELNVKSNWELKENWEINYNSIQGKAFAKPPGDAKKTGK